MKKFFNRKYRRALALLQLLMAFAVMGILAALTTSQARAQISPVSLYAATNLPSVITAAASSNSLTSLIPIQKTRPLTLDWGYNASAGTSNVAVQVTPTIDGTNLSTSTNWWIVGSANGTTTNHLTYTFTRDTLGGYSYLNVSALTNQNNGTVTNKGLNASY